MLFSPIKPFSKAFAVLALGLFCGAGRAAEAPPDLPKPPEAGSIIRNLGPAPTEPSKTESPIKIPEEKTPDVESNIRLTVRGWHITGAKLFTEEKLMSLIEGYKGESVNLAELRKATFEIAHFYRDQGYLARAVLPAQEIRNGIVEILIREARLGKIDVEDTIGGSHAERVRQTLQEAHPEGETIRMKELERGILLLNDLPGNIVSSAMRAGQRAGESDLGLKISPSNLLSGSLDYSNAGVHSVGMNQFGASLALNNPFKIGDLATLRLQGSSGSVYGKIAYSIPVGYSGLRVGLSASGLYYAVGKPFESADMQGSSWNGGIFALYPLLRGISSNLYITSGFDDRHYYNTSAGEVISDKEIQVGYLGLNGDSNDDILSGGINQYGLILSAGNLDLSNNKMDARLNRNTAHSFGAYQKFILTISRLQRLNDKTRFYAGLVGQFATKNLDSSEKFSLGGPYGVRAYPVNEALGDQGYLMNFELRYEVYEHVELTGFIDHGGINLHVDQWKGGNLGVPNNYTLTGGGIGVNWTMPGNFAVRGSIAQRIGSNPARNANGSDSDGSRQTPHFWVYLTKYF